MPKARGDYQPLPGDVAHAEACEDGPEFCRRCARIQGEYAAFQRIKEEQEERNQRAGRGWKKESSKARAERLGWEPHQAVYGSNPAEGGSRRDWCECENIVHLDGGHGGNHPYSKAPADVRKKTPYGTFHVCKRCATTCLAKVNPAPAANPLRYPSPLAKAVCEALAASGAKTPTGIIKVVRAALRAAGHGKGRGPRGNPALSIIG